MLIKKNQINIKEKNEITTENVKKHDTKEWITNNNNINVVINVTKITYFPYNDTIIAHYKCLRDVRKEENENQEKGTKILVHPVKSCTCSKENSVSISKPKHAFTFEVIIINTLYKKCNSNIINQN
jgi:hypothetical protein